MGKFDKIQKMSGNQGLFSQGDMVNEILQFINVLEWPVSKPFIINKTFHDSFSSEAFAKQYLINLFSLNTKQQDKLNDLITSVHRRSEDGWQPLGKIAKKEIPYWMVLQTFAKLSFENNIPERVSQMLKGLDPEDLHKVHSSIELLKQEAERMRVQNELKKMVDGQWTFFNDQKYCLDRNHAAELFGKPKGIFISSFKTSEVVYVLFVDCGFPIRIKVKWKGCHEEESFEVDGSFLMRAEYTYEEYNDGDDDSEFCYSNSTLQYLRRVLFVNSQTSVWGFSDTEKEVNTVLYTFLQTLKPEERFELQVVAKNSYDPFPMYYKPEKQTPSLHLFMTPLIPTLPTAPQHSTPHPVQPSAPTRVEKLERIESLLNTSILKDCNMVTTEKKDTITKFIIGEHDNSDPTKILVHEEQDSLEVRQIYFVMDKVNRKWKKIMHKMPKND